jgi:hypothetical protein
LAGVAITNNPVDTIGSPKVLYLFGQESRKKLAISKKSRWISNNKTSNDKTNTP